MRAAVDAIPDQARQPIPYRLFTPEVSGPDVAETDFTAFASQMRPAARPPGPAGRPSSTSAHTPDY
ncbi:MAG: hypothetical protein WD794_01660 [Mycobacteriales bacterium]